MITLIPSLYLYLPVNYASVERRLDNARSVFSGALLMKIVGIAAPVSGFHGDLFDFRVRWVATSRITYSRTKQYVDAGYCKWTLL